MNILLCLDVLNINVNVSDYSLLSSSTAQRLIDTSHWCLWHSILTFHNAPENIQHWLHTAFVTVAHTCELLTLAFALLAPI